MSIQTDSLRHWLGPLGITLSISGLTSVGVLAQDLGADSRSGPSSAIEEIVVTARKRAEFLEDTPIAVTALSAERLREADVTNLNEIRQLVPSLQIQVTPVGIDQSSQFRLRGVGTTRAGASFDPGVAVYFDGVYLPNSVTSVMGLVDVQQIEVLRGPQGTLFGKNSVGGAISITTAKPTEELDALVLVRPGNYGLVETRSMINIPIVDGLATRFSFTSHNSNGYHRNTERESDLPDREGLGFLGSVRWLPTDAITIDLSGNWSRNRHNGTADRCVVAENGLGLLAPPGFLDACRESRPFRGRHDLDERSDQENWGIWGIFDWDLSEYVPFDLSFKSIASWRGGETSFRGDVDGTELPVIKLAASGSAFEDGGPTDGDSYMLEGQLGGAAFDDRLNFIVGAFGFWEYGELPQATITDFAAGVTKTETNNWDWAVFTQATADITDWLSVTGGVRYTQEKKGASLTATTIPPDPEDPMFLSDREIFDAWTPMASVALKMPADWMAETPLDHLMGYFTYSRGFRGGGFNTAPNPEDEGEVADTTLAPFDPETLDSFEIGAKSFAFDDRLSLNLAAFFYDYSDIQIQTTELTSGGNITQPVRNAAEASARGIELEVRAMPLPGLVLSGSLAHIDTEYDKFDTVNANNNQPIDRTGESLNNTPKLQTNLAAQFTIPIELGDSWLHGFLTPRLQWYYQSGEHFDGPELREARQSGYNLLDGRLAYTFMDGHAQVALWGKNLTDEEYYSNAQPLASIYGFVLRTYNPPRTYGGEISYRFGSGG
jgi:iron complex outermembrane receptor protein